MVDIGKTLSDRRKELGKTVEEIHELTRVSIEHIKHLENNSFDFLPTTYVKSFLKTYADSVGLDSGEIVRCYLRSVASGPTEVVLEPEPGEEGQAEAVIVDMAQREFEETQQTLVTQPHAALRQGFLFPPGARILDWALVLGGLALLVLLILGYVQYRTELPRSGNTEYAIRPVAKYADLADVSVQELNPPGTASGHKPLEMQITAKTDLNLSLTIDEVRQDDQILSSNERRVWIANDRLEFTLRQKMTTSPADSADIPAHLADNIVTFSLSRENLLQPGTHD